MDGCFIIILTVVLPSRMPVKNVQYSLFLLLGYCLAGRVCRIDQEARPHGNRYRVSSLQYLQREVYFEQTVFAYDIESNSTIRQ